MVFNRITVNPSVCCGKPTIRGLRRPPDSSGPPNISCSRPLEKSFTTPHSDNTHPAGTESIYYAKRRMDNLPEVHHVELRDHTTAFGEIGKSFYGCEYLCE
jgi:hypothetical protein